MFVVRSLTWSSDWARGMRALVLRLVGLVLLCLSRARELLNAWAGEGATWPGWRSWASHFLPTASKKMLKSGWVLAWVLVGENEGN